MKTFFSHWKVSTACFSIPPTCTSWWGTLCIECIICLNLLSLSTSRDKISAPHPDTAWGGGGNVPSLQLVVLPTWALRAIYLIALSHSLLSLFQTSPYVPLLTSCLLPWLSGDDPANSLAENSTAGRQKLYQFLTYHLPLSPLSLLPVAAAFLTSFPPLSEERIFLLLFHVNSSIYLLPTKKILYHFLSCF